MVICNKISYQSLRDANSAIKNIPYRYPKRDGRSGRRRNKHNKQMAENMVSYKCKKCAYYHMSSHPFKKEVSRVDESIDVLEI